jgi:hypothetical protein
MSSGVQGLRSRFMGLPPSAARDRLSGAFASRGIIPAGACKTTTRFLDVDFLDGMSYFLPVSSSMDLSPLSLNSRSIPSKK